MRATNGKFTSVDKERAKARAYWAKGFEQGYRYATRAASGHNSASHFGRFGQAFAYGLQRGKGAGAAARAAGVDLSAIEM